MRGHKRKRDCAYKSLSLYLEAIVSIRIVVAVEVPVPGGVVNLPKVKVDALLTILGADSSDPTQCKVEYS